MDDSFLLTKKAIHTVLHTVLLGAMAISICTTRGMLLHRYMGCYITCQVLARYSLGSYLGVYLRKNISDGKKKLFRNLEVPFVVIVWCEVDNS